MNIADISAEEIASKVKGTDFSGVVSLAPPGTGASLDLTVGFADWANRIREDQRRLIIACSTVR